MVMVSLQNVGYLLVNKILIMENTNIDSKLSILKEGLLNLSKKYSDQVQFYPIFVDVFDEVLCDFEDGFVLLPSLISNGVLKNETILMIEKCNDLINFNLKTEDLLSDYSFEFSNEWNEVRKYAKKALDLLIDDIG